MASVATWSASGHGSRVERAGQRPGPPRNLRVAKDRQVCGQPRIDLAAVLDVEGRRLPAHQRRTPLGDPPRRQVRHRVRHLVRQRPGQAEVARPAGRRVPPGQRDLCSNSTPTLTRRDPSRSLSRALGTVEGHRDTRLCRGSGALDRLQQPELVDPLGIADLCVERDEPIEEVLQVSGRQSGPAALRRNAAHHLRCAVDARHGIPSRLLPTLRVGSDSRLER
jgi:hypothetical protein